MVSITGLEMPNAWRTGQAQDSNFDISADQLNVTANREMWVVPALVIDWQTVLHKNAQDPIDPQDLATMNYVDLNGANLWSTFAAVQTVNMDSNFISNLLDPVNPQDAATRAYVLANVGASDLDGLSDVDIIGIPADNEVLQFNFSTGFWENTILSVPAGSIISQDDSSVSVIDTGANGRVETTIDNVLKLNITSTLYDIQVPINMNSQQINSLGTPALSTDASTKGYVDTEIGNLVIPTELNELSDVTTANPAPIQEVLVSNGTVFTNQLLTKNQLTTIPIAYTDVTNTFSMTQQFNGGVQLGVDQVLGMQGSHIIDNAYTVYQIQGVTPPDPILTDGTIYLADGTDFSANNAEPTFQVLLERSGAIEKKPIVTSETVFALREFSNGMFTEETGVRLITDGGIGIRLQQFNENTLNAGFEVVLEGQIRLIGDPDISPSVGNTIDLTVGTDIAPTTHRVWTELVGGVPTMMSSTVEFPSTGDFAVIGKFTFQSQASVLADGPYADNAPDNEIFDDFARGHLAHINDRLVELDAAYVSGIDITVTPVVGGGTAADVSFTSNVGKSYELHLENIEAFDSSTGINLVENEGTQTVQEVTRVNNIGTDLVGLTCSDGVTVIGATQTINVVLYTVHIDSEPNQTNYGVNVPFSAYTGGGRVADAIADVNGYAVKNVPLNSRGTTMLIAEVVIDITPGPLFEVVAINDLRGQIPGAASSGGGTGGGAGELNDLSDVTIDTPLLDESLIFNGAGLWVNKLTPQLETANVWTNYQDYTAIADPTTGANDVVRFFSEVIDVNNTALYCYLRQDGIQQKVRIA